MTIEEAIKRLEIIATNLCGQSAQNPNLWPDYKAVDIAISALRRQGVPDKDVGNNEPLTLDEMRDMPCEPVYIVVGCASWWDIVSYAGMEYLYLKVEGSLPFRDYGKNWTAYRQKPKEGTV